MKISNTFLISLISISSFTLHAQDTAKDSTLKPVFRAMILSPGLEYEIPLTGCSLLALSAGVRPGAPHENLLLPLSGTTFYLTYFIEGQYKYMYNLKHRYRKNKRSVYNSGNYFSFRFLMRGPSFAEFNEYRIRRANFDFMISPIWGFQRSLSWFYYLIEVGPQFFIDVEGNLGTSLHRDYLSSLFLFPQIKVGINLF